MNQIYHLCKASERWDSSNGGKRKEKERIKPHCFFLPKICSFNKILTQTISLSVALGEKNLVHFHCSLQFCHSVSFHVDYCEIELLLCIHLSGYSESYHLGATRATLLFEVHTLQLAKGFSIIVRHIYVILTAFPLWGSVRLASPRNAAMTQ